MTVKNLSKNIDFIDKNKDTLLKEYNNKYLLVFEEKIINSYDTYETAAEEGVRLFGLEEDFLVYYITSTQPVNFVMEAIL